MVQSVALLNIKIMEKTTKHKTLESTKKKIECKLLKIKERFDADYFGQWCKQRDKMIKLMPYKNAEKFNTDKKELDNLMNAYERQMQWISSGKWSEDRARLEKELQDVSFELFWLTKKT